MQVGRPSGRASEPSPWNQEVPCGPAAGGDIRDGSEPTRVRGARGKRSATSLPCGGHARGVAAKGSVARRAAPRVGAASFPVGAGVSGATGEGFLVRAKAAGATGEGFLVGAEASGATGEGSLVRHGAVSGTTERAPTRRAPAGETSGPRLVPGDAGDFSPDGILVGSAAGAATQAAPGPVRVSLSATIFLLQPARNACRPLPGLVRPAGKRLSVAPRAARPAGKRPSVPPPAARPAGNARRSLPGPSGRPGRARRSLLPPSGQPGSARRSLRRRSPDPGDDRR